MLRKIVAIASVITALSLPAMAQVVCGDRGKFLERLADGYEGKPVAMGLASNGSVIEVLVSEHGSWTILVTSPEGESCLVASGEAWERLPLVTAEVGAGAKWPKAPASGAPDQRCSATVGLTAASVARERIAVPTSAGRHSCARRCAVATSASDIVAATAPRYSRAAS